MATPSLFDSEPDGPKPDNTLTRDERIALVAGCLNLCRKLARQAVPDARGAEVEDLESEAYIACCKAAKVFDPAGTAKFSTYATGYIRKRLKELAADQREQARLARGIDWGLVPGRPEADPDEAGDAAPEPAGPADADLLFLNHLGSDEARQCVALVLWGGVSPAQVAVQIGRDVKDVLLILRNAAKTLSRAKVRDSRYADMLAGIADAEDAEVAA